MEKIDPLTETSKNLKKIKSAITIAFIACVFFYILFSVTTNTLKYEELGALGDYMGGLLNPIIGFCAFLALLHTIEIQSKELKQSTEQLKESAETLKSQSTLWEKQNFENSFYSLLDWLENGANNFTLEGHFPEGVSATQHDKNQLSGRFALTFISKQINILIREHDKDLKSALNIFFHPSNWTSAALTHAKKISICIKHIDEQSKNIDKQSYYFILQSTLTTYEKLIFLAYCLSDTESNTAKIAKKYYFFSDLVGITGGFDEFHQTIKKYLEN